MEFTSPDTEMMNSPRTSLTEKTAHPVEDHEPADSAEKKLMNDLEGFSFPSLDLAYAEAKQLIDSQLEDSSDLDRKASILVGFAGVILAALVSSLSYLSEMSSDPHLLIPLIAGAVCIFSCAFAGLRAYRLRTYVRPMSIEQLWQRYSQWHPHNFKYQMIGDVFPTAYEENLRSIGNKAMWLKVSITFMTIGLVGLLLALLYGYLQYGYVLYIGIGIGFLLAGYEVRGLSRLWRRKDHGSGE